MAELPTPLSVAPWVLGAKRVEIDAARSLARRAELVDVLGQLIHVLQRERGASAIFLASQASRFADVRRAAIDEAGPIESRLRVLFATQLEPGPGVSAGILSLMAWVLLGLDALADLRHQIDRMAITAHEAVTAFSRMIAGPVELIFHVADATLLPSISRRLVALLHLVQGKEAAGQERALGGLLFASGTCSEVHRQRVIHLIDAQEHDLRVFAEFTEADLRDLWEKRQLTPGMARLERLRRTLCTARADGGLDSALADAWFEVCSERITALWDLEVELVVQLRLACEAQIRQSHRELEDSEGLLRRLRDNPPAHADAVQRFFESPGPPEAVPDLTGKSGGADAISMLGLLQDQAARLASMEADLGAARRALHERKVIERAKGVLMSRLGMTEEVAFRALQKTSMDQNRRLLDVAEATLALPDSAFTHGRDETATRMR